MAARGGADEGEFGVGILDLSVVAVHLVDEQWDGVALSVGLDGETCGAKSVQARRCRMVGRLTRDVEGGGQLQEEQNQCQGSLRHGEYPEVGGHGHVCVRAGTRDGRCPVS